MFLVAANILWLWYNVVGALGTRDLIRPEEAEDGTVAKLDFHIEIDDEQEYYHIGDEVAGRLYVDVAKGAKCRSLSISLGWGTHGSGNLHEEELASETVFEGKFEGATEKEFPFSFRIPEGPYTYHGDELSIDWWVAAHADVPWGKNVDAFRNFHIVPDQGQAADYYAELADRYDEEEPSIGMMLIISLVLLLIGVGLSYLAVVDGGFGMGVFALVMLFLGGIVGAGPLRRGLAERRLQDLKIDMPAIVSGGDELVCTVSFTPSKDTKVLKATGVLKAYEEVVDGSGSDSETITSEIFEQEFAIHQDDLGTFKAGARAELVFETQMPDEAPPSFFVTDNQLTWKLCVHLDIHRCPDWLREVTFLTVPEVVKEKLL